MRRVLVPIAAGLLAAGIAMVGAFPARADGVRYHDEVFTDLKVIPDLEYGQAVDYKGDAVTLLLDVIQPAHDHADNRAAVVWVHGGYFKRGSKDVEWYKEAREQFARAGYVVFSINYRLNPTLPEGAHQDLILQQRLPDLLAETVAAQHDAQAAVRWVRANAHRGNLRVDPDKIAIAGHSAGGITAQLVAFNDHDPGDSGNPGHSSRVAAAVASSGGSLPGLMVQIDPLVEPPLLVSHGVMDDVVPYPAAIPSCATTVALGNVCEQVLDPDRKHPQFGYAHWRDFLYRRMIQPPALQLPTNLTIDDADNSMPV
jgi:dienelactone hydrolase